MPGKTLLPSDLGLQIWNQPNLGSYLRPSVIKCKSLGRSPKLVGLSFLICKLLLVMATAS